MAGMPAASRCAVGGFALPPEADRARWPMLQPSVCARERGGGSLARSVSEPGSHPSLLDETRYPLTLGQLHLLTGASERQLRHWTDEEMIPSHRAGSHRRYYTTAVARALPLAHMTSQQLAALIALRRGGDPGRRLAVMIGSVMASVADDAGVGEPRARASWRAYGPSPAARQLELRSLTAHEAAHVWQHGPPPRPETPVSPIDVKARS